MQKARYEIDYVNGLSYHIAGHIKTALYDNLDLYMANGSLEITDKGMFVTIETLSGSGLTVTGIADEIADIIKDNVHFAKTEHTKVNHKQRLIMVG